MHALQGQAVAGVPGQGDAAGGVLADCKDVASLVTISFADAQVVRRGVSTGSPALLVT
jgi:hypothetical protein